jgi:hypothetical protein
MLRNNLNLKQSILEETIIIIILFDNLIPILQTSSTKSSITSPLFIKQKEVYIILINEH